MCGCVRSWRNAPTETFSYCHESIPRRLVTCVDFGRMLAATSRLLEAVDEAYAFLPNNGAIDAAVDECYHAQHEFAGHGELIAIEPFIQWALSEPDALCWLPTMHRIAAAESEQHDVCCSNEAYVVLALTVLLNLLFALSRDSSTPCVACDSPV